MTEGKINIRPREPRDDLAIAAVIASAFGGGGEARLVDALRGDGDCVCELVALGLDEAVAGHILFSRLEVRAGSQLLTPAPFRIHESKAMIDRQSPEGPAHA